MAGLPPWLAALPTRLRAIATQNAHRRHNLVHTVALRYLLVVPVLLAVATAYVLFVHSDVNVAMLFSQCHARARLPWLSHLPVIGAPSCFLVSFFQVALASSARAVAVMSSALAYVGALLTVSTVEAARICNGPSVAIAYPTGGWLVFNLMGGAMVWQLVIIPAFFRRSQEIWAGSSAAGTSADECETDTTSTPNSRHLAVVAEVVAIPAAVALGYVVPSMAMLATDSPAAIVVWLFFPLYVSAIRKAVRWAVHKVSSTAASTASLAGHSLHLESDRPSLLAVYAVPVVWSVAAHVLLVYSVVARADDRKELTRSTLKFIEIDLFFVLLTVLYWILVEAGWRVVAVVVAASAALGPGAGLCLGWIYRERQLGFAYEEVPGDVEGGAEGRADDGEGRADDTAPGEATPLLR